MRRDLVTSLLALLAITVLFGLAYPLATTGIAQLAFPGKSDGSRIDVNGKTVGSALIGQDFQRPVREPNGEPKVDADGEPVTEPDPRYFQSRPSATGYSANVTYFGNLGPNNAELAKAIDDNVAAYLALEGPTSPGLTVADVPADAVQSSASGVDPHISPANAEIQSRRVARARGLSVRQVRELVDANTDGRLLGLIGERGVNVLELNLALDREQR